MGPTVLRPGFRSKTISPPNSTAEAFLRSQMPASFSLLAVDISTNTRSGLLQFGSLYGLPTHCRQCDAGYPEPGQERDELLADRFEGGFAPMPRSRARISPWRTMPATCSSWTKTAIPFKGHAGRPHPYGRRHARIAMARMAPPTPPAWR